MDRSLTVRIPGVRSVAMAVIVLLAVGVGAFLGVRFGATLLSDPIGDAIASSGLHQVHTLSGAVYLGHISSRGADELRLDRPALIRQAAGDEGEVGDVLVHALFADPYDVAGSIAIRYDVITAIGSVRADSQLAQAYGQAIGMAGESPAPSP